MLENNAVASLAEVDNHKPDYLNAIGERTAAFEPLDKLVTRVLRVAETLDLNETALKALKELVRRIHGTRAVPKKTTTNSNDPNTDPANEHKYVSVSERSFTQRIEHFAQIIALLRAEPKYAPYEQDLTCNALELFHNKMVTTNQAAEIASYPLGTARNHRNQILYADTTGLVDVAHDVKKYVRGALGQDSNEYKMIQKLEFKKTKV
jgi:hypothetical protein